MEHMQRMVRDFHETFSHTINERPSVPTYEDRKLRARLIAEEFLEYIEASNKQSIVGVADALADLLYVIMGAALTWGIDMEPIFDEVHRSNMTKVGGHKDEHGKWIKPESYSPADLVELIIDQCGRINPGSPGSSDKEETLPCPKCGLQRDDTAYRRAQDYSRKLINRYKEREETFLQTEGCNPGGRELVFANGLSIQLSDMCPWCDFEILRKALGF